MVVVADAGGNAGVDGIVDDGGAGAMLDGAVVATVGVAAKDSATTTETMHAITTCTADAGVEYAVSRGFRRYPGWTWLREVSLGDVRGTQKR